MSGVNEHEAAAEAFRAQAQETLASIPAGSKDLVQIAQVQMLQALVSVLLALSARGPAAPSATPLR